MDVDEGIEEYLLGHELWERHPGPPAAAWAALHVHQERLRERLGVDEVELERVITTALEARRAQRIAAGREGQCSK